ncbi:antigen WC1.1-like [Porphyrio hochstetteri]
MHAAQVVCRELGCGLALAVPGAGWFEAGTGPFWQGGFECTGTEPLLSVCARRLPRSEGCTGHATIICSSYTGFRLAGNSSSCAGRVEVEAGGMWGSLCASSWDLPAAHVLCHHLGCGPAVTVLPGGYFGGGDRPLRQDTFGCVGSERHPGQCPTMVLGQPACLPSHSATVNCSGVAEPLQLVEGESRCDGRLEVATSLGAWARVPAGLWDNQGASVVCRQLGCGVPEKVYTVPGSSPAALQGLWCAGTEHSLAQCNVSGMAAVPTGSPEEVALVCSGSRRVMLVGGTGRCAGRVEVYINGTWGSVCQDAWDLSDATVVCRQLGCGTALEAPGSAPFGPGTGPLWLDAGGCAGTEASLWDCPALAPRVCRRGGGAGAVCSEHLSLRLTGGSNHCSGHLEVLHNGTWGRVCANGTSAATATIVCQQLGCGDRGTLMDSPVWDPAPAWLSWVGCEEGSCLLWRCPSAPWHLHTCSPGGDAFVTCHQDSGDASGTPTPGVPSSRTPLAEAWTVSLPTVLCMVLGILLFLALGVLAVQACHAEVWCQGPRRAPDAISDAVYEELDYALTPEYQEMPSRSDSPAQHDPPHYYDDATAALEGSPSASAGDVSEESWGCGAPTAEGQAAKEGISANTSAREPACCLPAASAYLRSPLPLWDALLFPGPRRAGCCDSPSRDPVMGTRQPWDGDWGFETAEALRRQSGSEHREVESAMCRKRGCWEGGGEAASSAKTLQSRQESLYASPKDFDQVSSHISSPLCVGGGICLPFALPWVGLSAVSPEAGGFVSANTTQQKLILSEEGVYDGHLSIFCVWRSMRAMHCHDFGATFLLPTPVDWHWRRLWPSNNGLRGRAGEGGSFCLTPSRKLVAQ